MTELAHGFDPVLMRYARAILLRGNPNSIYVKMDYISLLVKASILPTQNRELPRRGRLTRLI